MKIIQKLIVITLIINILIGAKSAFAQTGNIDYPDILSEAAIVIDAKTGDILFSKNSDERLYPASITKIVTAILAIESGELDSIVTVSKHAREVDGTRVYLEEGEEVPLKKLIQGLLINSGNDAGVAIAEHLDHSVQSFASRMNEFVSKELGLVNTNFENPHGLFGENHYSTAFDFAMITKYALQNETFKEIIGTSELEWKGEAWKTTLYNHHSMLREWPYDGIIGGKNGYIDQSGHTLVTAAQRDGMTLIAVVLKADTKRMIYQDTENLLDFGFNHFETIDYTDSIQFQNESDKLKYKLIQPLIVTKRKGENVEIEVNNEGNMLASGEEGRVINTYQLEKLEIAKNSVTPTKANEIKTKDGSVATWWYIFSIIIIFLASMVFIIRKRKKS